MLYNLLFTFFSILFWLLIASIVQLCVFSVIIMVPYFKRNIKKENVKIFLFLMVNLMLIKWFIHFACSELGIWWLNLMFTIIIIVVIYYIKCEMNIHNNKNKKLMESLYIYTLTRYLEWALSLPIYLCKVYLGYINIDMTLFFGIVSLRSAMPILNMNPNYSSSNLLVTDTTRVTQVNQLLNGEFNCDRDVYSHFGPKIDSVRRCSSLRNYWANSLLDNITIYGGSISIFNGGALLNFPSNVDVPEFKRQQMMYHYNKFIAEELRSKALISDIQKDVFTAQYDTGPNWRSPRPALNRVQDQLTRALYAPRSAELKNLLFPRN